MHSSNWRRAVPRAGRFCRLPWRSGFSEPRVLSTGDSMGPELWALQVEGLSGRMLKAFDLLFSREFSPLSCVARV